MLSSARAAELAGFPGSRVALALALAASGATMTTDASADSAPAEHRAEVKAWHATRLENLRREDGWLSLVGLFWLD
jgi:uncharacterized protein (DUF1684 family)